MIFRFLCIMLSVISVGSVCAYQVPSFPYILDFDDPGADYSDRVALVDEQLWRGTIEEGIGWNGSDCYMMYFKPDQGDWEVGVGFLRHDFPQTNGMAPGTIHVRALVKYSEDYHIAQDPEEVKDVILRRCNPDCSSYGSDEERAIVVHWHNQGEDYPTIGENIGSSHPNNVISYPDFASPDYSGEWISFEYEFDLNEGTYRIFIDTPDGNYTSDNGNTPYAEWSPVGDTSPAAWHHIARLFGYVEGFEAHTSSNGYDPYLLLDEIVMDDSYIGPPSGFISGSCPEGEITEGCVCAGVNRSSGYCCNDVWFDSGYSDIYADVCSQNLLYVDNQDPDCNDSTSRASNSGDDPWCSLGRAVWGSTDRDSPVASEAAQAGDVVIVREGTYTTSGLSNWETTNRWGAIYNPVNDGGPSNGHITIRAENPATWNSDSYSVLESEPMDYLGGTGQPVIGANSRQYIVWDGFYIDELNADPHADTGASVIVGSSFIRLRNLHIVGHDLDWGDNHNAIRIENSDNVTIRNNYLTGYVEDHGAGVMTYGVGDALMEHNEITTCLHGLFLKGYDNPGPFTLRYNYIHDSVGRGVRFGELMDGGAVVSQNVLLNNMYGCYTADATSDGPMNTKIVNNIIDGGTHEARGTVFYYSTLNGIENALLQNNIVVNANHGIDAGTDNAIDQLTSDYNNVHNCSVEYISPTGEMTLSEWQSAYSKDLNSFTTDPEFMDPSGGDYRLRPGSPCENAGIDILDLDNDGDTTDPVNIGAYITGDECIGLLSGCEAQAAYCGDGSCAGDEDWESCPQDCFHPADSDEDGMIRKSEIDFFITSWLNGNVRIDELMSAVGYWKSQ